MRRWLPFFGTLPLWLLPAGSVAWGGEEKAAQPQTPPAVAQSGSLSLSGATKKIGDAIESLGIQLYGHFKLDMSRDTAETNFGNTAFFVKNYADGEQREELNKRPATPASA